MKTENKAILIGYVGNDPKTVKLPSGDTKSRFSVATHHPKKLVTGETEWLSTWHNVVAYGESVKHVTDNFSKGSHIKVEGRLMYRTYTDKDGNEKAITEILGYSFINLDR